VVQPVPRSTMNVGVVGPKVQRPAVGRQPSRPARIHEDTGEPTQLVQYSTQYRNMYKYVYKYVQCKTALTVSPKIGHSAQQSIFG